MGTIGAVMRGLGRTAQLIGGLIGLGVLMLGAPLLLLRYGEWPITGLPSGEQLREAPSHLATDDAMMGVVVVALWLAWAVFVGSVLAEVVAQIRRAVRGDHHVRPDDGSCPRLSKILVGLVVAGILSTGDRAGASTLSLSAAAGELGAASTGLDFDTLFVNRPDDDSFWAHEMLAASQAQLVATGSQEDNPDNEEEDAGSPRMVTVEQGDTAWSLAEEYLGDGARWREIWELTRDRVQGDGERWSDMTMDPLPGWVVLIPAEDGSFDDGTDEQDQPEDGILEDVPDENQDPEGTDDAGPPDAGSPDAGSATPPGSDHLVVTGDHFWGIAKDQIRQAWGRTPTNSEMVGYWQELVNANRDRLLPPYDPDLVYPEQSFALPELPPDPTGSPDSSEGSPPEGSPPEDSSPEDESPPEDDARSEDGEDQAPDGEEVLPDEEGGETPPDEEAPLEPDGAEPLPDEEGGEEGGDERPTDTTLPPVTDGPDPGDGSTPDGGQEEGAVAPTPPSTDTAPASAGSAAGGDDGGGGGPPWALLGGGAIMAGLLVALARGRRRNRYRHLGDRTALPAKDPEAPEVVEVGSPEDDEEGDEARLVDAALKAAAAGGGRGGLPRLRWVEVDDDGVTLRLEETAPPPPGFVAKGDDAWGTSAGLEDLETMGASAAAPLPTLVPVGMTADDAEVLIELEGGAVHEVDGPPDQALGVLRALAVAAATVPWGERAPVLLAGMRGEVTDLEWVRPSSLGAALGRVEDHVDRVAASLRRTGCYTTSEARASGVTPEMWEPQVVVSALPVSDRTVRERLATLARRGHEGVAVVARAGDRPISGARTLTIGDDGWLSIDGVEPTLRPHLLDVDDGSVVVSLLDVSGNDDLPEADAGDGEPDVALGAETENAAEDGGTDELGGDDVSDLRGVAGSTDAAVDFPAVELPELSELPDVLGEDPESEPAEAGPGLRPAEPIRSELSLGSLLAEVEVLVRVLGEVEAVRLGAEGEVPLVASRQKGLEAVAYLALRETAVGRDGLESALFPDGTNAAKTVYNTITRARNLVGQENFPLPEGGRYALSDAVATDYGLFCELLDEADELGDEQEQIRLLSDAVSLVRGEPFTGVGLGYSWVGPHRGIVVAQVIDAAERLARLGLEHRDWRLVERSARRGLRAFPADERLYRLLMWAASASGQGSAGVHRVYDELCQVIADPELGMRPEDALHPETIELYEELSNGRDSRLEGRALGS